jgi:hypothetical protein
MRLLLLTLTIGFMSANVSAQYSESISSDRPGMSYSANTVGARVLQFQMGGQFRQTALSQGFGSGFIGGAFDGAIRVGVIERLEVGFSVIYTKLNRENPTRYSDPIENLQWSINLRGNVLKSDGKTPNIGLLAEVIFPDRETEKYTDFISQHFKLLIEQPLEKRIRLSSNIGMIHDDVATFQYTLNLSVDISPIATIFIEHFGQYTQRYDQYTPFGGEPEKEKYYYVRANGGFAIRPLPNFQIDVEGGFGSWEIAPNDQKDWYVGLGMSWRAHFKKKEKKKET